MAVFWHTLKGVVKDKKSNTHHAKSETIHTVLSS